jgi:hypothetical protein
MKFQNIWILEEGLFLFPKGGFLHLTAKCPTEIWEKFSRVVIFEI